MPVLEAAVNICLLSFILLDGLHNPVGVGCEGWLPIDVADIVVIAGAEDEVTDDFIHFI